MPPVPCSHCGMNFMRHTTDLEAERLCNNCLLRENIRKPKKENTLETIKIVIECPLDIHASIEEYIINNGLSYSKYFLDLIPENFMEEKNNQTSRAKKYKK